eukprot:Skav236149  [mRNA]  locus=scaffold2146:214258:216563:+ [translate_table: standard]
MSSQAVADALKKAAALKDRNQMLQLLQLSRSKCPSEIRAAGKAAFRSPAKLAILFEQWVACDGHWSESSLLVTLREEHRHRRVGARKWLTYPELVIKYGGPSPAQKICAAKQADATMAKEQIRPHPDCPKDPDPWLSCDTCEINNYN